MLARSIGDRALADELREAAMDIALSLGQWPHRTSDKGREGAETATRPASGAGEGITIGAQKTAPVTSVENRNHTQSWVWWRRDEF